jgi:hypothetical protein
VISSSRTRRGDRPYGDARQRGDAVSAALIRDAIREYGGSKQFFSFRSVDLRRGRSTCK